MTMKFKLTTLPMAMLLSFAFSLGLAHTARAEDFNPTAKLGLDLRADLMSTDTKASTGDTHLDQFAFGSERINLLGQLSSNTTYRVRFDAANTLSGKNRDNIGNAINYLYITHKVSDLITVRAGKQFVVTSAWEYNYDTSKIYHYGETFLKSPSFYETGAAVEFNVAGQIIGIQATNSQPDTTGHQQGHTLTRGIYWYGSLNGGKIQPIASAVWFPRVRGEVGGETDSAAIREQYSVGAKFDFKPFDFDISVGEVKLPSYTYFTSGPTANTKNKEEWMGVVLNAHYREEGSKWQPFTKITYDKSRIESNDRASYFRASLGTEYYPESDKWWYHLTYTFQDNKDKEVAPLSLAKNNQTINQIMVGAGVYFY